MKTYKLLKPGHRSEAAARAWAEAAASGAKPLDLISLAERAMEVAP